MMKKRQRDVEIWMSEEEYDELLDIIDGIAAIEKLDAQTAAQAKKVSELEHELAVLIKEIVDK